MYKDENGDLVLSDDEIKDLRAKGLMPPEHIYIDAMAEKQEDMDIDHLNTKDKRITV